MHIAGEAIVCAVLPHGEHGAVVRVLTPNDGLQAGFVRGGRSRRLRPVLLPGNVIHIDLRARTDSQLGSMTVELVHSRAPLMGEPLAVAAIDWATALTAVSLPEALPYPRLSSALSAVLDAIEAAPAARGWAVALVRYELLLLAELGFGLDLSACIATGTHENLHWVSPRSGGAVSGEAGAPYADRLLALPPFLIDGSGEGGWPDILDGLKLTGFFLDRDLLTERRGLVLDARTRLVDRLRRIVG
ncbi:MAG: DNA repair protein RecO [Sphingomonadaceae bacterium]